MSQFSRLSCPGLCYKPLWVAQVSDGFEDSRKKRLQELAAERTGGGSKGAVTKAQMTKPSAPTTRAAPSEAAASQKAAPVSAPSIRAHNNRQFDPLRVSGYIWLD